MIDPIRLFGPSPCTASSIRPFFLGIIINVVAVTASMYVRSTHKVCEVIIKNKPTFDEFA